MKPILAAYFAYDPDFIFFAVVAFGVALILALYFALRRLTGVQWLVASCLYFSVTLFYLWLYSIQLPILNTAFQKLQPYLSLALIIVALVAAKKRVANISHKSNHVA